MNETIRKRLIDNPYANIYHHSLHEALKAWGEEIENDIDIQER